MQGSKATLARSIAVVVCCALTSASSLRAADAPEPSAAELAAAREIFAKGVELEEAHDWAGALEQFRKVASVKVTAAVRFHLGLCLENTGKLVDALNEFNRAEAAATPGEPDAALIVEKSKKHVAELETRLPRVVVVVAPANVEGAEVAIDDAPIAASLLGTSIPIDPGAHVVRAHAPRRLSFERSFDATEGSSTTISVTLAVDPNAPPEPTTTADATPTGATSHGVGPWPWIVGGIGVASLVGAGTMFVLRSNALSDLDSSCPTHTDCPASEQPTYDRGRRDALVGDVLLGVGVAAVAASVVLFTLRGEHGEPRAALTVSPLGPLVVGAF